ncbi:RdgB/HAM1 family non-canonical purine NTP pyrophosphatase [Pseudoclavibacter sp. CFCC 11306]|uniref:RdgB/HAM1 family non-canonical purine NTP pyrophosphatase n=1 Tax=Pseudoclavibacter sp. CFCC 11306 TaxID=1564493 RepID=UPI0013013581|nr:RdgB/HAM1 family non-canonical purine NTP pyrophosphatase [Pseudoclavibacter sp. CFCC 11306]KAB1657088.1 RdgB/HAM1 family non-canonical purine NTP pyrophosphatase [Pseudoclavibacter sp. CFCC 11306]
MGQSLILASHNAHKLTEFRRIVAQALPGAEVESYEGPEPVESGVTFEENALIKARAAARHDGRPTFADDSGIAVDVLGGSPGIFSARWGGTQAGDEFNRRLLLQQLADVPDEHRAAEFVCAIALVIPSEAGLPQREHTVIGRWPGSLLRDERGDGGFGYDPIFLPRGEHRSSAELSADEKNSLSHRARAFRALVPILRDEFGA